MKVSKGNIEQRCTKRYSLLHLSVVLIVIELDPYNFDKLLMTHKIKLYISTVHLL